MRAPFKLAGREVQPGEHAVVELHGAQLYTQTPVEIPVHVIHGRRDGPVLMVCAAIHGDELNGVEIIRRLLRHSGVRGLRGTLLAVPVVNVFGFIDGSRYLPDRRDLNRCFPGSEKGSLGARMAWVFKTQVLDHVTHGVDLHTGAVHRTNLPQIRANLDNEAVASMAHAFGVPVVMHSVLREGSMREVADAQNIPVITYEAGEALRYEEGAIRAGVRGVLNVMRHLGMIRSRRSRKSQSETQVARSSTWVRAGSDGVFRSMITLGAYVKKGQCIGRISDPFSTSDEEEVCTPCDGILVGRNNLPLVHEGEALFNIARYQGAEDLAQEVEDFHNDLLDGPPVVEDEPPIAP
jgi:predicted deacylase